MIHDQTLYENCFVTCICIYCIYCIYNINTALKLKPNNVCFENFNGTHELATAVNSYIYNNIYYHKKTEKN